MANLHECVVTNECIFELIDFFATRGTQYRANLTDRKYEVVEKMCLHLLARDYYIQTIDNSDGSLCPHYPSHMMVLERDLSERDKRKVVNDTRKLKELFMVARSARCFCRFPVPVILFNKKNVCRSSTLSTAAELYGRSGIEWIFSAGGGHKNLEIDKQELPWEHERRPSEWSLLDQAREYDSQLISVLGIGLICDLMVEMRKTAYGVTITSSEKADGNQWYSRFNIASIPYPGCEFFYKYRSHSKHAEELHYDWSKTQNDAVLSIPSPLPESVGLSYKEYQSWNVVKLTQNYLKLILHYLHHEDNGVLVHCVSGWDRTPLYIALTRLSLWADGLIHASLEPPEILYLTLAYDWFMFGHKFEERLKKNEEVLYFCFDFLKHITSDEYSINTQPANSSGDTCTANKTVIDQDLMSTGIRTNRTGSLATESTVVSSYTGAHMELDDTDVAKSLRRVTVDAYHGNCLYHPSLIRSKSPPIEDVPSHDGSVRTRRLLSVRDLFLIAYKKALPYSEEGGVGGRLAAWMGRVKL